MPLDQAVQLRTSSWSGPRRPGLLNAALYSSCSRAPLGLGHQLSLAACACVIHTRHARLSRAAVRWWEVSRS